MKVVIFKNPIGNEINEKFKVVEDRGDKFLVELICDLPIRPTFVYLKSDMKDEKHTTAGNIKFSTQGIKGYKPAPQKVVGYICVDLRHKDDYIAIDDFTGYGANYQQRELTQIEIVQNGVTLFKGDKYDLFDQLKKVQP